VGKDFWGQQQQHMQRTTTLDWHADGRKPKKKLPNLLGKH
jgi:hypothetical protein